MLDHEEFLRETLAIFEDVYEIQKKNKDDLKALAQKIDNFEQTQHYVVETAIEDMRQMIEGPSPITMAMQDHENLHTSITSQGS